MTETHLNAPDTVTVAEAYRRRLWEQDGVVLTSKDVSINDLSFAAVVLDIKHNGGVAYTVVVDLSPLYPTLCTFLHRTLGDNLLTITDASGVADIVREMLGIDGEGA